jgi:hypothetical protein
MIFLAKPKLDTIEQVRNALQTAIEVEHCIIPPYLCATFTLHNTGNEEILNLVGSVVGEEMLHMAIASNVLNAISGHPDINKPSFIPKYPGPVPGGVDGGLTLRLEKFSLFNVENMFMVFEQPEDPIIIKQEKLKLMQINSSLAANGEDSVVTIGEYYTSIIKQLTKLEEAAKLKGKTIFTGNPDYQVVNKKWFPPSELFPITDLKTAVGGIELIIDQGEGTKTDPFVYPKNEDGNPSIPAHYYRFQEIVKGRTLVRDEHAESKYSFSGPLIPFNGTLIPNMVPNPRQDMYVPDTAAFINSRLFNYSYSSLLNCLHQTFNGQPANIDKAIGIMFSLRLAAFQLLQTPAFPTSTIEPPVMAGPSFEYVTTEV